MGPAAADPRPLTACMTMFDDPTHDSRVLREASTVTGLGYEVEILSAEYERPGGPSRPYVDAIGRAVRTHRIRVGRRKAGKLRFLKFYLGAIPKVLRIRAAIYHAQDLYSLPVAWLGAKRHGRPLIYDSHEYYLGTASLSRRRLERSIWWFVERLFIGRADEVITVCDAIADRLRDQYGIRRPRVLRNVPVLRAQKRTAHLRKILGLDPETPILLYQGVIERGRGLFRTLDALAKLEGCHFVALGDGSLREEMDAHARRLGLSARVTLLAPVAPEQLMEYTASADVGLCLIENAGFSYYHSLPNKLFEYMMAGVPVIASDFPEMGKVVRESRAGLAVDPEDIAEIARAVRRLTQDRAFRETCGHRALRAASDRYNWDQESRVLADIYREQIPLDRKR